MFALEIESLEQVPDEFRDADHLHQLLSLQRPQLDVFIANPSLHANKEKLHNRLESVLQLRVLKGCCHCLRQRTKSTPQNFKGYYYDGDAH